MNKLITTYAQHLNLRNATFSRIEHEDALVAVVYKVTQPAGTQFILKICERSNDFLHEQYFLNYFAGKLPVPRIVQVVQPATGIHGALLMECLPGTLPKISDLTNALAYEMGSLLARIHLNRTTGYGDLIQPHDLSPEPRVHFTLKFEEGLAECTNHLPQELINQCRIFYDTHLNFLNSVDGPCITHRDFRPGNVIVHNGNIKGIIDWSSGRASFAQEDFCSMEHDVWPTNSASKNSFLAGYASIRPVPHYDAMLPFLRLSKAIATIGFLVKRGTWKSSNAQLYTSNRRFLDTLTKPSHNSPKI